MAFPLTELQEVKNLTSDDVDDTTIESYLLKYRLFNRNARVYLAAADVLEFISRDYNFESMKLDNQSYTGNTFSKTISDFRALAAAYDAFIV